MEYIPGAMQAFSTVSVGYPFDTVKSHMQYTHHKNSITCTKEIFKNHGIRGFYRGASVPYLTLIFKRGIQFRVYEHLKKEYNPYLAGTGTAISMCWISSPMQNIKLNMQVKQHRYNNPYHFITDTYQKKGILGFYRGFRINLLRDITFGTIYLGTYGTLREKFGKNESYYSPFFAEGCSSILTWSILLPIDHIKTLIQTNKQQTIPNILKKTPIKSYWKSLGPTTLRVFPVAGISMMTYEVCRKIFEKQ